MPSQDSVVLFLGERIVFECNDNLVPRTFHIPPDVVFLRQFRELTVGEESAPGDLGEPSQPIGQFVQRQIFVFVLSDLVADLAHGSPHY